MVAGEAGVVVGEVGAPGVVAEGAASVAGAAGVGTAAAEVPAEVPVARAVDRPAPPQPPAVATSAAAAAILTAARSCLRAAVTSLPILIEGAQVRASCRVVVFVTSVISLPRGAQREELLDAARIVVERYGIDRLCLQAVAAQADAPDEQVRRQFADRDALLLALLAAEQRWLDERIGPVPAPDDGEDPVERVMAAVAPYFDAKAERGPVFAALLLDPFPTSPAVARALVDHRRRVVLRWTEELSERSDLDFRAAKALAVVLIGAFEGAARQWWFGPSPRRCQLEDALRLVLRATLEPLIRRV